MGERCCEMERLAERMSEINMDSDKQKMEEKTRKGPERSNEREMAEENVDIEKKRIR